MRRVQMTKTQKTYAIGALENIPIGEGRVALTAHMPIAVFRARTGEVFATQALCPHRAGPLADGIIGGGELHCPLHGYKFDLATGAPIGNECEALRTYPVEVGEDGEMSVTI